MYIKNIHYIHQFTIIIYYPDKLGSQASFFYKIFTL